MEWKTPFNYCNDRKMASDVIIYKFCQRGCSSKHRALVSHARGTGMDAPNPQLFRKDRKSGNKHYRKLFSKIEKKTMVCTSNIRREYLKQQCLMRKRLVPRIANVFPTKRSKKTLVYWHVNQRPPSDINSSVGPHLRDSSIEKAIHWHVRNKWIDDPNRHSQN